MKLTELLIEVANKLGFARQFTTPGQRQEPSPDDIAPCQLLLWRMAVILARLHHGSADPRRKL
jgi:hypothetical protein